MKKIMIVSLVLITLLISACSNGISGNSILDTSKGTIAIALDDITSTVQKYDFDANGVKVTYFAVKGSDGEVRTAFDACDVCGGKKGYRQQGSDIVCNNCGKVFRIDGLGTQNKGYGCWPSYLKHVIEDGNVIISKSELEAGSHRFA